MTMSFVKERGKKSLKKSKALKEGKSSGLLRLKLELPFAFRDSDKLVLKEVDIKTTVSDIKTRIEEEFGILPEMYFLSYLDSVPLEEPDRLWDYDVVHKATLRINVWRMWLELLKSVLLGNIKDSFACSQNIAGTSEWNKYCAWVVLFIASHWGHHHVVAELLKRTSLAINSQSPAGLTAMHAAARMGRWKALCMLIDNGADVRITSQGGDTAQDLAYQFGHKKCENSLRFCQWNLQKHSIVQKRKLDYDAEQQRQLYSRLQFIDSSQVSSFHGSQGQVYIAHQPNPVSVASVKKFQKQKASNPLAKKQLLEKIEEDLSRKDPDEHGKLHFNYGWFDDVRAQQLIPSTRDIMKYSDPSSCQLRPRSLLNPGGYTVQLYNPPPAPASGSVRGSTLARSTSSVQSQPPPSITLTSATVPSPPPRLQRSSKLVPVPVQPRSLSSSRMVFAGKVGGAAPRRTDLQPLESAHSF